MLSSPLVVSIALRHSSPHRRAALFLFHTHMYYYFASKDIRAPCHCPLTSGEISLSSSMLYEPGLEKELHALHLQELCTMSFLIDFTDNALQCL